MMSPPRPALSVLVVDDDPDTAESLTSILHFYGFRCRYALSGPDALNQVADDPPDAIVFDVRMPHMSGWMFARRIADSANPTLLIAVTGCGLDEDRRGLPNRGRTSTSSNRSIRS